MKTTDISVVITTRNEAGCIVDVIRKWGEVLSKTPYQSEIVLVDFSEDDTLRRAVEVAENDGVQLTPIRVGRPGRGYAVKVGVKRAKHSLLCFADGDGSHDPRYFLEMLKVYVPGSIVMASRFPPLGWSEEHTFLHYCGNRIAAATVSLLFHSRVTDITNCFGIMSKDIFDMLNLSSDRWSFDAQLICRALKRGIPIREIPSLERKRKAGTAKFRLIDGCWRIALRVFLERILP